MHPNLDPIKKTNRRDQAYQLIRNAIITGKIRAGTKLVTSNLAKQLGVSRTPLRESLQLLEAQGFLRRLPTGVVEVVGLDKNEIEEIYAIRGVLEGLLARYAALRVTPKDLKHMQHILDETQKLAEYGNYEGMDVQASKFHGAVEKAAGLAMVGQQLETLRGHINRHRACTISAPGRAQRLAHEHALICEFISLRDPDRSENAMRQHLHNAWLVMKKSMENHTERQDSERPVSKPSLQEEAKIIAPVTNGEDTFN